MKPGWPDSTCSPPSSTRALSVGVPMLGTVAKASCSINMYTRCSMHPRYEAVPVPVSILPCPF
eukprot:3675276-Rhodomonas_salina.1